MSLLNFLGKKKPAPIQKESVGTQTGPLTEGLSLADIKLKKLEHSCEKHLPNYLFILVKTIIADPIDFDKNKIFEKDDYLSIEFKNTKMTPDCIARISDDIYSSFNHHSEALIAIKIEASSNSVNIVYNYIDHSGYQPWLRPEASTWKNGKPIKHITYGSDFKKHENDENFFANNDYNMNKDWQNCSAFTDASKWLKTVIGDDHHWLLRQEQKINDVVEEKSISNPTYATLNK